MDLAQLLNVDMVHIEAASADLLREDPTLHLIQGELINTWVFQPAVALRWSPDPRPLVRRVQGCH